VEPDYTKVLSEPWLGVYHVLTGDEHLCERKPRLRPKAFTPLRLRVRLWSGWRSVKDNPDYVDATEPLNRIMFGSIAKSHEFRATATVLESPNTGRSCASAGSWRRTPPHCSGLDLVGWTWNGLVHESARGTRWGTYVLTGTYEGTRFHLDRASNGR